LGGKPQIAVFPANLVANARNWHSIRKQLPGELAEPFSTRHQNRLTEAD
jgi:hypothetical protein